MYFRDKIFKMTKSIVWLSAALLSLCACSGNEAPKAEEKAAFQWAEIAGIYQDTIPSTGAIGNIVQLTINDDATYAMVERILNPSSPIIKPMMSSGQIELLDNNKKLKLTPRSKDLKTMWLQWSDGQMQMLDSLGNVASNPEKYRLERISKALATIGNDRLYSIERGTLRYPIQAYGRPGGAQIQVPKFYLQTCPEFELGLANHYITSFKGKLEDKNPVALVLGQDANVLRAVSNRTVLNADGASLDLGNQPYTLTSVVINKTPENYLVTYTYLDAQDENWMGQDVYDLKNNTLIQKTAGAVAPLNAKK
jgi:NlpE N-terminal domain